jgi:hypothetical protein
MKQMEKRQECLDLHRSINEFKTGYPPGTGLINYENGDLLAVSHIILNRWKNYF